MQSLVVEVTNNKNNDLKAIFSSAGRIIPFNNNGSSGYKFHGCAWF
jgi:hypothetical protein